MFRDLETKRLYLKSISHDDAAFFFREFSNDEVNRYLYDAEPCASEDEAEEWISFYLEDEPRNQHRWILVLKETGEKIGTCGFHCWNRETGEAEVGYDLQPRYWRKGYMTEALREIVGFAAEEMGIESLYAHISIDNTASRKTAEKLGFFRTGKQYFEEFHGKKYLHDIYALSVKDAIEGTGERGAQGVR